MSVAVEEMDGVERASVGLNQGEVTLVLDDANEVTLAALREVIRTRGFTPREADVRARGTVVRREDGLYIQLRGGSSYRMVGSPELLEELQERRGEELVVHARIAEGDGAPFHVGSVGDL